MWIVPKTIFIKYYFGQKGIIQIRFSKAPELRFVLQVLKLDGSFFPKGFCWGFNFVFTTSGFPLLLQSGSHTYLGFRMLLILSGGGGDARERRKIPLVGLLSLCSCSLFKGGAQNLTVKSILWRGSAYRFLPCPFTVKLKKDQKKLEEEGHACLQSVGRGVWPNVASCLACGSRGEFIYLV